MPAVAALVPSHEALQSLRRTLPVRGPWSLARCPSVHQLERTLRTRLVDAVVFCPTSTPLPVLAQLREAFPHVPWIAFAPFRPDDGTLLLASTDSVQRWQFADGRLIDTLSLPSSLSVRLFSPDGAILAAEDSDHRVILWRLW